jgi:hypothetical protein
VALEAKICGWAWVCFLQLSSQKTCCGLLTNSLFCASSFYLPLERLCDPMLVFLPIAEERIELGSKSCASRKPMRASEIS